MRLGADGAVAQVSVPARSTARSAGCAPCASAPDGALFVSTSNGDDDQVLRVTPV